MPKLRHRLVITNAENNEPYFLFTLTLMSLKTLRWYPGTKYGYVWCRFDFQHGTNQWDEYKFDSYFPMTPVKMTAVSYFSVSLRNVCVLYRQYATTDSLPNYSLKLCENNVLELPCQYHGCWWHVFFYVGRSIDPPWYCVTDVGPRFQDVSF